MMMPSSLLPAIDRSRYRRIALLATTLALAGQANARGALEFSWGFVDSADVVCGEQDEGEGCAEISAVDEASGTVFTTNAEDNVLRVLRLDRHGRLSERAPIDLSPYGAAPNSVAVSHGRVAVAMQAETATDPGTVVVLDLHGVPLATYAAGALPDMVTFSPDGRWLLAANEGEPNDDYTVDPPGSISIIDTHDGTVRTAGFEAFENRRLRDVRIFGPGAGVAADLEPEYITVSSDSRTAWVTLQENNAIAIVDVHAAEVRRVVGLGTKDHSRFVNRLDASDRDGGTNRCRFVLTDRDECIKLRRWPIVGMYQPDAIDSFRARGREWLVIANEGDARDYDGFSEEARVGDEEVVLDPFVYPDAARLKDGARLGRLKLTTATGDIDGDGDIDLIHAYGARSFSVLDARARQVYDSGDAFERDLRRLQRRGQGVWQDGRSDDKGPEPESIVVGELAGTPIAFIGLERVSGVFVYELSNPRRPTPIGYIDTAALGDVSPEGLVFLPRSRDSGLLLVSSELSNTVSSYQVMAWPRRQVQKWYR